MPVRPLATAWRDSTRPSPADLDGPAYDQPPARPRRVLLVCTAPRSSSKRLARLLLAAGIGVPMEYFRPPRIEGLGARFGTRTLAEYLAAIRARRTVNGVFASLLHWRQYDATLRNAAGAALLRDATLVRLERADRDAQVVSLAAAMLSGNWGFERPREAVYEAGTMASALDAAAAMLAAETAGWEAFFAGRPALALRSDEVNAQPAAAVARVARALDVTFDRDAVARMAAIDPTYEGERALKKSLAALRERRG